MSNKSDAGNIIFAAYTDNYVGFQVLMAFLKAVKDSFCFISRGTRSQILGSKYEMDSIPSNTDSTRGLLNSD